MPKNHQGRSSPRHSIQTPKLRTHCETMKSKRQQHRRQQQTLLRILLSIVLVATTMVCFPSAAAFVHRPYASLSYHPNSSLQPSGLFATENDDTDLGDENIPLVEQLQDKLVYIQALEERNKAQIDSFIDEEHQWESMEEYERELLSSKDDIEEQLSELLAKE